MPCIISLWESHFAVSLVPSDSWPGSLNFKARPGTGIASKEGDDIIQCHCVARNVNCFLPLNVEVASSAQPLLSQRMHKQSETKHRSI